MKLTERDRGYFVSKLEHTDAAMSASQDTGSTRDVAGDGQPPPSTTIRSTMSGLGARFANLSPTSMVVFSVVCVMVLVVIIAFIMWRIMRRNLKSAVLVKIPLRMYGAGLPVVISKSDDRKQLPPTLNGQEYSYSFWLYLVQYDPASSPIMLFGRGVQPGKVGGSPLSYLDNNTNKMYISVAKSSTVLTETIDQVKGSSNYVTGVVDYVPLQRWVNVTFVIQDYLMTIFMDGDMYTVRNVTDAPDVGTAVTTTTGTTTKIFGPTSGDITVGDSSPQPKAFMSQLKFYNFALTQRDIKSCYASGPTSDSSMNLLGIPAYGIRSPMYRIDANATS